MEMLAREAIRLSRSLLVKDETRHHALLVIFLIAVIKYLTRSNLGGKGAYFNSQLMVRQIGSWVPPGVLLVNSYLHSEAEIG